MYSGTAVRLPASETTPAVTTAPRGNANTFTDKACDTAKSGYLNNSPGTLDNLAACTQSCQSSAQCKSITFWPTKWCSHFSTTCDNLVTLSGATAVRFPPVS